jgi:hypothetical protein
MLERQGADIIDLLMLITLATVFAAAFGYVRACNGMAIAVAYTFAPASGRARCASAARSSTAMLLA